jgi:hypothetical protein
LRSSWAKRANFLSTGPSVDIIRLYGLRFKIECSFKQAVRQIGSIPFLDERHDPVAVPQRQSIPPSQNARYRNRARKMRAYHAFIQAGVVAQGLLQYLAIASPKLVWSSFGSWLLTIRPDIPPSELSQFVSAFRVSAASGVLPRSAAATRYPRLPLNGIHSAKFRCLTDTRAHPFGNLI